MTKHRVLAGAVAAGMILTASAGKGYSADIRSRTTYFDVRGATLDEIDADLAAKGPKLADTGLRHPGATQVKFDGQVVYRKTEMGCGVASTGLRLRLVTTLPRWRAPRSANARTRIVWKTLSEDIARHEHDHGRIAALFVRKMESAIRNLGTRRACSELEAAVDAVTKRYLAEHEAAQRAFDAVEGREVNERLRRALQRNVEAAAAANYTNDQRR